MLSNKNVMINLQTASPMGRDGDFESTLMRGIPEDEELDASLVMKDKQMLSANSGSRRQETLTKSQTIKKAPNEEGAIPRKLRNAPKLVSANSAIMKKFAYEIGDSVGGRYDSIVRADVARELRHFDK